MKIAAVYLLAFVLFPLIASARPAERTRRDVCLPFNDCGTWRGCVRLDVARKQLLGASDEAICRKVHSSLKDVGDSVVLKESEQAGEKGNLHTKREEYQPYVALDICKESAPVIYPVPYGNCPADCGRIPACKGGPASLNPISGEGSKKSPAK